MTSADVDPNLIEEQRARFGRVYATEFEDVTFFWRPLTSYEYRSIFGSDFPDPVKEETICYTCVFYPQGFDFSGSLAGYPTILARQILNASYYDSPQHALDLLNRYRKEMQDFDCQMDCIIAEAFPMLPIDSIRHLTMEKRLWLLSRAEWSLANLRGVRLMAPARAEGAEQAGVSEDPSGLPVYTVSRGPEYKGPDPDWICADDEELEFLAESHGIQLPDEPSA